MLVDPWSISPAQVDQLAGAFFAASLFPYLAFLAFLGDARAKCPSLALNGFRFLLVFVGATIPAGIVAKVYYNDILANVDILHGSAESLLTITNLLIVEGFRRTFSSLIQPTAAADNGNAVAKAVGASGSVVPLVVAGGVLGGVSLHAEPANALSLGTWVIHISSLLEWLAAMAYVWAYADVCNNRRWRGLTWAMLPLHSSGLLACTYHFFYNHPNVGLLVVAQAALTTIGNALLAVAAFRITRDPQPQLSSASPALSVESSVQGAWAWTCFWSVALSVGVKYGELWLDVPFEPSSYTPALFMVIVPSALNALKWLSRSDHSRIPKQLRALF